MKKKKEKRCRIIGLRLTSEEFQKIEKKCKQSTCLKLSEYVRYAIFEKPIVTTYRNNSLDDYMAEAAKLRAELNHIGVNFNQAVKRLHILRTTSEFRSWLITYEMSRKTLFNKVDEIKRHIHTFAESWLQN